MRSRVLVLSFAAVGMLAIPEIAQAAWATTTTAVNMRACAGTSCAKLTVIPAGARVWVFDQEDGWARVRYAGQVGYSSGRYFTLGTGAAAPPPSVNPAPSSSSSSSSY